MTTTNRTYIRDAFRAVAAEVNELHPGGNARLDGQEGAGPRIWTEGHPRAVRFSLVKFMPRPGAEDDTLRNHGMGLDYWANKGCHLRAWTHGKGYMEVTFATDPTEEELDQLLRFMARWVGFQLPEVKA